MDTKKRLETANRIQAEITALENKAKSIREKQEYADGMSAEYYKELGSRLRLEPADLRRFVSTGITQELAQIGNELNHSRNHLEKLFKADKQEAVTLSSNSHQYF